MFHQMTREQIAEAQKLAREWKPGKRPALDSSKGIVSKRLGSRYRSGGSKAWLKFKKTPSGETRGRGRVG